MPEVPCVPDEKTIRLRLGLIVEEVRELTDALMDTDNPKVRDDIDLAEVADALADIDYVVEGMRNSFGINGDPIADEVHRANMDKFGPGSWKREDGKQMKPPDWKPPDIEGELRKQGWRQGDG
jgi:predicted HAD superfamily Cof-like phosphohydrolase